jgi:hypothetical protein
LKFPDEKTLLWSKRRAFLLGPNTGVNVAETFLKILRTGLHSGKLKLSATFLNQQLLREYLPKGWNPRLPPEPGRLL